MTNARTAAYVAAAGLAAVFAAKGLRRADAPLEPPEPYALTGGRVVFAPGAKMLARLEIVAVGAAAAASTEFRTVGQIIALSNASGSLTGERVGWVELDPQLTASVGLKLSGGGEAGTAYGLTALAAEYAPRVNVGQRIAVMRYGLKRASVTGVIARVVRRPEAGDRVDVVFRFAPAQDWFPGTNCEVAFPVLAGRPVRIPMTAPVHEGTQEFVWKEVAPGQFEARNISLVEETPDEASVLGLNPGDRIVARGAILLKPLLKPLLAQKKD